MIQGVIHKLEVAGGMRYLRVGLIALAVIGATAFYNFRGFRNMASQEAMDCAQLARNIATGKGYTTYFIRPFSMFLQGRQNEKRMPVGKGIPMRKPRGATSSTVSAPRIQRGSPSAPLMMPG